MTDAYEHNPGDHEDPVPGPLWILTLLGAVLLTVVVFGLTALFYTANYEEQVDKVITRDPVELEKLRDSQQAQIAGEPRWVETIEPDEDGEDQIVRKLVIPIEQAMEIVTAEMKQ